MIRIPDTVEFAALLRIQFSEYLGRSRWVPNRRALRLGCFLAELDFSVIKEAPKSYDILFDPKYKGKVGVPDDPLGAYGLAARVLNLNSSKLTEADFKTVTDWLKQLVKQTKGVSASYGDVSTRFIAGDIALAFLAPACSPGLGARARASICAPKRRRPRLLHRLGHPARDRQSRYGLRLDQRDFAAGDRRRYGELALWGRCRQGCRKAARSNRGDLVPL